MALMRSKGNLFHIQWMHPHLIVGSSLKSATWLSLPCTRRRSPLRHVASFIPPGRKFCPTNVPPSPDTSQSVSVAGWERGTIQLLLADMSGSSGNTYPENIQIRRFNFPGQTCPDPPVTLTRRTSASNDSDSLDSLARQTLATHRIHFRPQSKSKLQQY
uniref:Uncharacterized protein n=1 Tax=Vitis vinifera TaxID=29760 RepID=A5ANU7_VITVI|nr:hypothetical protein VITISV_013139 [Vitis vinifera]